MTELSDLSQLTHEEKDALIQALWMQVRLRRARVVCLDETSVRIDGRTCWN